MELHGHAVNQAGRKAWLRTMVLVGAVYGVVGVGLAEVAKLAPSTQTQPWRLAAWVISAAAFAAHIGYELFRLHSSPRTTALHVSLAAALGAFLLAVAANVHGLWVGSSHRAALAISLVAWPVLVAVPAFLAALAMSAVLSLMRRGA